MPPERRFVKKNLPSQYTQRKQKAPITNHIDIHNILRADELREGEILHYTTLMIKNIPTKFTKVQMLQLLDKNHRGKYNYFYLPIDLQNRLSVGFAFINFTHPLYILDFLLEFQGTKWQDVVPDCFSSKCCQIVYANTQGMGQIKSEFKDSNLM